MDELEAALVRTPSVIDREQREARELAAPGADGEE